MVCVDGPFFIQIEGVKRKRPAFGHKDPAECLAGPTVRVGVTDIDYTQLAGREQFANILARFGELPFQIQSGTRNPQLIGEFRNANLLRYQRGLVAACS